MTTHVTKIEISFPRKYLVKQDHLHALIDIVSKICRDNEQENTIAWPSGYGSKITYMPMTREEELSSPIEFDSTIFEIQCSEREAWPGEKEKRKLR